MILSLLPSFRTKTTKKQVDEANLLDIVLFKVLFSRTTIMYKEMFLCLSYFKMIPVCKLCRTEDCVFPCQGDVASSKLPLVDMSRLPHYLLHLAPQPPAPNKKKKEKKIQWFDWLDKRRFYSRYRLKNRVSRELRSLMYLWICIGSVTRILIADVYLYWEVKHGLSPITSSC